MRSARISSGNTMIDCRDGTRTARSTIYHRTWPPRKDWHRSTSWFPSLSTRGISIIDLACRRSCTGLPYCTTAATWPRSAHSLKYSQPSPSISQTHRPDGKSAYGSSEASQTPPLPMVMLILLRHVQGSNILHGRCRNPEKSQEAKHAAFAFGQNHSGRLPATKLEKTSWGIEDKNTVFFEGHQSVQLFPRHNRGGEHDTLILY